MGMNFGNNGYGGYGYNQAIFNPNLNPQQRLYQMEHQHVAQMQSQPPMQSQIQQAQMPIIRSFYVGSIDEAKGVQTPFDGSVIVLINKSLNEVYIKKLGDDGNSDFRIYTQSKKVEENSSQNTEKIIEDLKNRIEILEKEKSEKTEVKENKENKESSYPITKFKKGSKENDE